MKRLFATLAVTGMIGASLAAMAPAASAAAQACVTSTISTGYRTYGSTAVKSSTSSCNDLNLTYANATRSEGWDYYRGMYRNSAGTWFYGAVGWYALADGTYAVDDAVLATDVLGGTTFSVESWYNGGDTVKITH